MLPRCVNAPDICFEPCKRVSLYMTGTATSSYLFPNSRTTATAIAIRRHTILSVALADRPTETGRLHSDIS